MNNIFTSILIQQLLFQSAAYITSDHGIATQFDFNAGWVGTKYLQFTQQVNFKSAFQNVPQVVITPQTYAIQVYNTQYGCKVSISEVTTTYFKILLVTDYGNINTLWFNWFAIDDQRIEVIHKFNQDNPPTSTNVPHQNKNINTGFIVLTSFGGSGAIDFILKMPTITDSYVQVTVTDSNLLANTHLSNLGYSIILGPPEAFETSALITNLPLVETNPAKYCSPTQTIDPNKLWFYYPLYFSISSTIIARMMYAESITGNTISYCFICWGAATCIYTKYGHKTTTINFQLTTILYPMLMKKIRVSRSYTEEVVNNIQIQIGEVNKNYDTIGEDSFEITSSIQTLTIVIKVKCEPNQKVTGKFQRYTSGSNKYFTSSINCFLGQNYIAYYTRFYQAVQQYQYLIVTITADQILVTQKISNQYLEYYIVAQANILQS